jgi:catecholate siderophore receptor
MEKNLPLASETPTEIVPGQPAAPLLPLGALMLAASFGSLAQTAPAPTAPARTLPQVVVKEKAEAPEGKDAIRATTTTIGKGTQELRDVPQSITVVTEKLIDDRNLETVKDVLRNTAGISFLAAEGGEEDIRLRGFSLAATGDIFLDGMRDPAFYDRDTFNNDRIEVLRGSASMLFGRGSTGGAVNQVTKAPRLGNDHEVGFIGGNHGYNRVTGDFNFQTGESSAVRMNVMRTHAQNNGSGARIDKEGAAVAYRFGIGSPDEVTASYYYLNNDNGINYGLPWIRPTAASTSAANTVLPGLSPTAYYGLASDYNAGLAKMLTVTHVHRFDGASELRTQVRRGQFERDLRASAIRFGAAALQPGGVTPTLATFGPNTVFTRGTNLKVQGVDTLHAQSDFSKEFKAFGLTNELKAGVDYAQEQKTLFAAPSAAQGGVTLAKPTTLAGTPDDGAFVAEAARPLRVSSDFTAKAWGAYVQDLVQIAPAWKVLGGLRYDNMDGRYNQFNLPAAAPGPLTLANYQQTISNWSKRFGVLYQPNDRQSYHFSYGTSFNTSGDTYSYNALSANTPPEQSENIEVGARFESADKRMSTRVAVFRSTKKNERNTDPDTAATRLLLSGKRHTAGFEIDVVGRITPKWETYVSYMWMPIARVDDAASTVNTVGNMVGDRPGLTPKHSGTVWTTYQVFPQLRLGGGVNFRSKQAPADVTAPGWQAPGFATIDLMAEYAITPEITLKGNIVNATDKYYADSLYRGHYVPGAGRLVQVGLSARF